MALSGGRKLDDIFQQIWLLEKGFAEQPSMELARSLVETLSQVGTRGYFNPVLGISWMPSAMEEKMKIYKSYLETIKSIDQDG